MHNPEKFVSLLFMTQAETDGRDKAHIATDAICDPENLQYQDYYLVLQMPKAELFSTKPTDVTEELCLYTIAPDWKTTGRRTAGLGDIVCLGSEAYMIMAEDDVLDVFKPRFTLLGSIAVNANGKPHRIGLVKINNNKTIKDIVCQHQPKT